MLPAKKIRRSLGFTLVELLIVLAIISILISIGLVALNRSQATARDAQRRSDIETIRGALEEYYADFDHYPSSQNELTPSSGKVYLKAWPQSPQGATGYTYAGGGQKYCVEVGLEHPKPGEPTCDNPTLDYGKNQDD